ncbi:MULTISPECIES: hypothetical protein [Chromobacterium]|uniref:hypothetical protein n=1 Tax=Chromobacterium TaxID=535 RepID=UPI001374A201|nr:MULTISPECIES: hypothetical protein [Chromobacterium]QOD82407.1 hypothetical protein IEZ30_21480 [Chromobacterium haemolyticum]
MGKFALAVFELHLMINVFVEKVLRATTALVGESGSSRRGESAIIRGGLKGEEAR